MSFDLRWRPRLTAMAAGAAAFALFQLAALVPAAAEMIYGRGLGPFIASLLSRISGFSPISLAELVIVAFLARQVRAAAIGGQQVWTRQRRLTHALKGGALRVGADIGVVVALFYVLWGFNYARPPLEQRQAWAGQDADTEEIARLAREMVEASNFEYASLTRSDDLGEATRAPGRDELFAQLADGWERANQILGISEASLVGFGRPKALLASGVLDYGLTSGFYFPWTAEANFNRGTPAVDLPQVIAHEMSHQRGFAREDEANFVGYLVAASTPEPYPRYSAYVFAQRQLLSTLARYDRDLAGSLARQRLAGVQRDIDVARAYWAQFEGRASRATASANNAYLRTNRVPGGIRSYGRSVELLVGYARSRGGWLVRR